MPSDPIQTTDETLVAECETLIRTPGKGRIWAIRHVRAVRRWPLREAHAWVMSLKIEPQTAFELREQARELRQQSANLIHRAEQYEADAEGLTT